MDKFSAIFKALSDETRWNIIELLLGYDLCVGGIASRLGISSAAVSQHIQILRKAGIVKGEKKGYWTHYTINREVFEQIAEELRLLGKKVYEPKKACIRQSAEEEGRCKDMCKACCMNPDKLKDKPEKCTSEQIKECHGETTDHPCEKQKEEE
ncbi:MAG TPA: metalloregulator ArsR/SmtB family transcription factor [Syntrophorhabdaceae bacterium]|nr:metalloregulator ArsR/SmtB family transcription factor [Syntrophorhabdaceae bacterium]